MAGSKTVINRSSSPLRVTLIGRLSDNPSNASAYQASTYIAAGGQAAMSYGNDANPYLNEVRLQFSDPTNTVEQSLVVFQRGSSLDNAFNMNSVFEVNFNAETKSFSLSAHN